MQGERRVQQVDEVRRYRAPGNPILGAPGLRQIGLKTLWRASRLGDKQFIWNVLRLGAWGKRVLENTENHPGHCLALFRGTGGLAAQSSEIRFPDQCPAPAHHCAGLLLWQWLPWLLLLFQGGTDIEKEGTVGMTQF